MTQKGSNFSFRPNGQ